MGYATDYELSLERVNGFDDEENIIEELRTSNESAMMAINAFGDTGTNCKWYEHEKDMCEFSKLHPEVLFVLRGDGEENEDVWLKYFLNGKMQVAPAKISFDPFDESKLETVK